MKEFPNDLSVIYDLMYALQAESRKENADEIIEYGQRILNESTDNSLKGGALQSLCFTYYYGKNDAESAKKYARMAGIYAVTVNEMMPHFMDGEAAVEYCQSNIQYLVQMIETNTEIMINKGKFSIEDRIKAREMIIKFYEMLYSDSNYGFYHVRFSELYEKLARNYLKINDYDRMFDCLEKSTINAIAFDGLKDGEYTAFLVNKLKIKTNEAVKDFPENRCGLLLKLIDKYFAEFKGDQRMEKIIDMIEPIAYMG